jgi:hypothetical protein
MRGGLIIVGIVFWICVSWSPLGELAWRKGCEVAQSGRYLNGDYTSVFSALLNDGSDDGIRISILKEKPFYYLARSIDTMRLSGFTDESFDPLKSIDFSQVLASEDLYNKQSIIGRFYSPWDSTMYFLFEVNVADQHYIGPAQIIEAQADFDAELERIVHVTDGWSHTYYFYESYGSYWQYIEEVTVYGNSDANQLNFSLAGFVGLQDWSHGTFQSAVDVTYYRIEAGRLTEKFRINSSAYQGLLWMSTGVYIGVTSETELLQIGGVETFVEHHIRLYSYDPGTDTTQNVLREETVTYSLVEQEDGSYLPNKSLTGFNVAYTTETCMETYFYPEVYANAELNKMKKKGNAREKELLKDFVYDSTETLR